MNKRPKSWIIPIALIFLALVAVIIVGYIAAEPPPVEHPGIEFLGEGVEAVVPTSPVRTEMPEIIIRTFVPDLPCEEEEEYDVVPCCEALELDTLAGK